ncbi:dNTP triphosphohydrolase [Macrococcoides caseolyticum]|uniref:deoxyguanosinetriphosphate triphosphohydrolase family protein n=1 Tax=Macrococcoides caseolyticum TaxID=69966 RepID=UPI001060AE0C|nr:dNTP triphosphohydrolase [Macrococcus caseolyticus]TDM25606.1 dNTP triphosphohydrolase [Macrococcus caseolyticus]
MRIKKDKDKIIDLLKEQSEFLNKIGVKRNTEEESNERKRENIYDQDYARILYSSSFRRLQGKMQLFPGKNNSFYRNRLTHSLEVEQIAKSIANLISETVTEEYFPLKNIVVVQSGALAHDIGNPPFGHSGERKLNQIMENHGGFEGNAQGLRVIMHLERKKPTFDGLNLSYRTLLSIVKYFKKFENGQNKKFIYDEEYNFINEKISPKMSLKPRTIDVQIVDLADEIAYCTHDLEDALRNNYFTIEDLIFRLTKKIDKDDVDIFRGFVRKAKILAESNTDDSIENYAHYFRKELSSILVDAFIKDIGVVENSDEHKRNTGTGRYKELGFVKYAELISNLKKSIFEGVTRTPEIIKYEKKGDLIIQSLFDFFLEDKNEKLLPPEYRYSISKENESISDEEKENLKYRKICDYISGMMDTYAIALYEELREEGLLLNNTRQV